MGQRLVTTIRQDGKDIAAVYYHWGAYSVSALYHVQDLINCLFDSENPIKDLRLRLIRHLESTGGGIDGSQNFVEHDRIKGMYPKETFKMEGIDRNNGLIALSEEGINSLNDWSEGDITIDLDAGRVFNNVGFEETLESVMDWKEDVKTMEDIPKYEASFFDFPVEEIEEAIASVENAPYLFRDGTRIYSLIA